MARSNGSDRGYSEHHAANLGLRFAMDTIGMKGDWRSLVARIKVEQNKKQSNRAIGSRSWSVWTVENTNGNWEGRLVSLRGGNLWARNPALSTSLSARTEFDGAFQPCLIRYLTLSSDLLVGAHQKCNANYQFTGMTGEILCLDCPEYWHPWGEAVDVVEGKYFIHPSHRENERTWRATSRRQ